MLIHVNKNYFSRGKTGKGKFAGRLVRAWREMGVDVIENSEEKADIALHIGRMNYSSRAKRHVLRVGPACINTNMNWRKINHEKAQSVKKADAIIYQSGYSKKIYHKLVCRPNRPEVVIFNGADPRDYEKPVHDAILKNNYQNIFLASTRIWLKQKRLKYIIRAFLESRIDALLVVCGDTLGEEKKYRNRDNILFTGSVKDEMLESYYRISRAMIHITWIDACPNSVVESLVAGCPVICTNQGGTHELMEANDKTYGACTVLRHDPMFKFRSVNLEKPPKSDKLIWMLGEAVKRYIIAPCRTEAPHLHIENIAKQYLHFFKGVL